MHEHVSSRIHPILSLSLSPSHRSAIVCVLDMEYEGDSISGMTYELDVPSFPYGFFDDVEYSKTILSISSASIRRAGGGRGAAGVGGKQTNSHGGGVISMKNGATAKKKRRDRDGDGNGGLRGSNGERNGMLFDRSRGRRLAQTMGNRWVFSRKDKHSTCWGIRFAQSMEIWSWPCDSQTVCL